MGFPFKEILSSIDWQAMAQQMLNDKQKPK
jgi:hypothetical protein